MTIVVSEEKVELTSYLDGKEVGGGGGGGGGGGQE